MVPERARALISGALMYVGQLTVQVKQDCLRFWQAGHLVGLDSSSCDETPRDYEDYAE